MFSRPRRYTRLDGSQGSHEPRGAHRRARARGAEVPGQPGDVPGQPGSAHSRRLRSLLLTVALAGAVGAAFDASSAPAEGQATDTAKFSCAAVTYSFTGFPNATGNSVVEIVKLDGVKVSTTTFKFNGPSGSNVIPISASPGHHEIDADAFWNTNGVKGNKDIPAHDGITCAPTVTSIAPESGTTAGGSAVKIDGTGFIAPATVTIGGKAIDVEVVNEGELTAVTSAHAAGSEQVVVRVDGVESTGGPSGDT